MRFRACDLYNGIRRAADCRAVIRGLGHNRVGLREDTDYRSSSRSRVPRFELDDRAYALYLPLLDR